MKNIAIIPARSGSKGLPDKNILPLCGKPLIAHTIDDALNSGVFDEVMVSTDSEKYAQIARSFGANVPFLRSEKNSSDASGSWDVVREVLDNYKQIGKEFDTLCLLQPTSPLRTALDIGQAYDIFNANKAVMVAGVCEADHPPQLYNVLGENNSMDGFIKADGKMRRQDNETYYRINGAVYIVDVPSFLSGDFLYTHNSYAYIMDKTKSVDIDDEFDFKIAEFLLEHK